MKFIGDLMAKAKKKLTRKKAIPQVAAPAPAPVEVKKPEPLTVGINAKYLRAMRHVASQRDIRYYLNGVLFQATKEGGRYYVATDGHRIAVIHEPWGSHEIPQDISLIIPRAVAAKATPILKKDTSNRAVLKHVEGMVWTLQGGGDIHQTFSAIDGKFPEWEKVLPESCSGEVGAFNWTYLHDLNLLTKEAFGASYSCEVKHNGNGAAIVTCGTYSFLGMVMPMRMSQGVVPQWAVEIQKANAEKKAKERAETAANDRAQPVSKAA